MLISVRSVDQMFVKYLLNYNKKLICMCNLIYPSTIVLKKLGLPFTKIVDDIKYQIWGNSLLEK